MRSTQHVRTTALIWYRGYGTTGSTSREAYYYVCTFRLHVYPPVRREREMCIGDAEHLNITTEEAPIEGVFLPDILSSVSDPIGLLMDHAYCVIEMKRAMTNYYVLQLPPYHY